MEWLEIFLLGLISGLTEFTPVSSGGHQRLFMHLFGGTQMDPLCRMFLSIGSLVAVVLACRGSLRRLLAERSIERRGAKFRAYGGRRFDYRIVKSASLPIAAATATCMLLRLPVGLPFLTVSFILCGIILFVCANIRQGNKDSRKMNKLDSLFIGLVGCISAVPGMSLTGLVTSAGIARGAQRQTALNWALLISMPILLLRILTDMLLVIAGGTALNFIGALCCLGGAVFSYIGGRIAIQLVRFAVNRSGLSGFAYYLWGVALLTFILFLIT